MSGDADPRDEVLQADERAALAAFMDGQRLTVLRKLDGLDEAQLRTPAAPSGWHMLGVVNHLALVERWWFRDVFAGEDCTYPWTDEDPDADFRADGQTVADVLERYRDEVARATAIVAAADLDAHSARPGRRGGLFSLRWIVLHMMEETARHLGHLDLAREALDGATGEW